MDSIFDYFEKADPVWGAFLATTFTWLLTACGAAFVFFFKSINRNVMDGMLGFTGGVMVAASIWSLLIPAIDMSPGEGFMQIVPAVVGFLLGAIFLFCCDKILPHCGELSVEKTLTSAHSHSPQGHRHRYTFWEILKSNS